MTDKIKEAQRELRESLQDILDGKIEGYKDVWHMAADEALLKFIRDLGCEEEASMFESLDKWYD